MPLAGLDREASTFLSCPDHSVSGYILCAWGAPGLVQLAVESVFLDAAERLVGAQTSGLSERQREAIERLAFDWIINRNTYIDSKHVDLMRARERVRAAPAT